MTRGVIHLAYNSTVQYNVDNSTVTILIITYNLGTRQGGCVMCIERCSLFGGSFANMNKILGQQTASSLERCPYSECPLTERLHCISYILHEYYI